MTLVLIDWLNYPYIPITCSIDGWSMDLTALVDTGFDGALMVPAEIIPRTIQSTGRTVWTFPDGSRVGAFSFAGEVRVGSELVSDVLIYALGDEVLVGRLI